MRFKIWIKKFRWKTVQSLMKFQEKSCTLKSCEIKLNFILNWKSIKRNQAQFYFMFSLDTPTRFTLQKNLPQIKSEITQYFSQWTEHTFWFAKNHSNRFPTFSRQKSQSFHDVLFIHFSEQKSLHFKGSGFLNWLVWPFYEKNCEPGKNW